MTAVAFQLSLEHVNRDPVVRSNLVVHPSNRHDISFLKLIKTPHGFFWIFHYTNNLIFIVATFPDFYIQYIQCGSAVTFYIHISILFHIIYCTHSQDRQTSKSSPFFLRPDLLRAIICCIFICVSIRGRC